MVLTGVFAMMMAGRPAAAAGTDPCSDPALRSASVQSTLQVKIRGVDWPSMTSVMQITVPESWQGTSDLFGDAWHQGSALACFMPISDYDYQAAPPDITVQGATQKQPAQVIVTNVITMTDDPEAQSSWREGPWTVTKGAGGYQVAFAPQPSVAVQSGSWTVKLDAPGLNIVHPAPPPAADDGKGDLAWSFPAAKPPAKTPAQSKQSAQEGPKQPAPRPEPRVAVALTSPWQVHMNLAADRWPMRWLSDASWGLSDGVLFDVVVLVLSLRLLRRRSGKPEERSLPAAVITLSCVSLIAYAYYLMDNYIWHTAYGAAGWKLESLLLFYIAVWLFFSGLGKLSGRLWLTIGCLLLVVSVLILSLDLSQAPMYNYNGYSGPPYGFGVSNLLVLLIPLLLTLTLAGAGAVLWISRMWPFGKGEQAGLLRSRSGTWFARNRRVVVLLAVALFVSGLVLGQSAASAYYYWQHSDLWSRGPGVFTWMAADMINDVHWWIGDGLQWPLFYAILVGLFAVLRAMSADARGVFFAKYPDDRVDLTLMAAVTACVFIGTWGYYAGFSVPIPFIVAFVLLIAWGLTRKLSKKESEAAVKDRPDLGPVANGSLLGRFQNDLLTASDQTFKPRTAVRGARRVPGRPAAGPGTVADTELQTIIPLDSLATAGNGAGNQNGKPPELTLQGEVDPGVTALALGPASTWWDNGEAAVQRGIYLTIVPIGFELYIMWTSGNLSQVNFPFGLQDAIGYAAANVIGWIAGLFMFGALLPYFRGVRTPVKGLVFGLIGFAAFAADAGIRYALGLAPYPTFMVDGLLAIALFATAGLLLDISTLQKHNDQGLIGSIYRLGSVRVGVTYATTLIIVGVSLWQAVYLTGQSAQQRATNLSNAAQTINSVGGSGKS